jgi:hypothetical protein
MQVGAKTEQWPVARAGLNGGSISSSAGTILNWVGRIIGETPGEVN